jgi:hypothetical protein
MAEPSREINGQVAGIVATARVSAADNQFANGSVVSACGCQVQRDRKHETRETPIDEDEDDLNQDDRGECPREWPMACASDGVGAGELEYEVVTVGRPVMRMRNALRSVEKNAAHAIRSIYAMSIAERSLGGFHPHAVAIIDSLVSADPCGGLRNPCSV